MAIIYATHDRSGFAGSGTSQDPYIEYEAATPRDITGPLKIQAGGKFKISAGKILIKT